MFVYGADFFTLVPGLVLLTIGLLITLPTTFGSVRIGSITLSLYWQLVGVTMVTMGLVGCLAAVIAKLLFDYTGRERTRWLSRLRYTRTVSISAGLVVGGIGLLVPLLVLYLRNDYTLPEASSTQSHLAVSGVMLLLAGSVLFVFTLLVHAAALASRYSPEATQ